MLFFYKIDVKVVTNWSERLEKHQTVEILLMVDFLCIFKNVAFLKIFSDFWNSPVTPGKIVKYTEFIFENYRPNTVKLD